MALMRSGTQEEFNRSFDALFDITDNGAVKKSHAKFNRSFDKLINITDDDDVKDSVLEVALDMRNKMRARVSSRTGVGRKSINARKFRDKGRSIAYVAVDRTKAFYLYFFEYGTIYMSAIPFFRPVYDAYKGTKYKKSIETALSHKLKKIT